MGFLHHNPVNEALDSALKVKRRSKFKIITIVTMVRIYDDFGLYDSFLVCGDIHGEFKTLLYELKRKEISNAVILLAGDCGIGFEKQQHYNQLYQRIKRTLAKINWIMVFTGYPNCSI